MKLINRVKSRQRSNAITKLTHELFSDFEINMSDDQLFNSDAYVNFDDKHISMHLANELSELDFVRQCVSVFHEYRHIQQRSDEYLCANELACIGACDSYYMNDISYHSNPREIDAEHFGIVKTYDFLCKTENKKLISDMPENLIVNYVNDRLNSRYKYFIQADVVSSVDDIDDLFENAYELTKVEPRYFDVYRSRNDIAIKYLYNEQSAIYNDWRQCKNPIQQDAVLAASTLHLRPVLESNRCLSDDVLLLKQQFDNDDIRKKRILQADNLCDDILLSERQDEFE